MREEIVGLIIEIIAGIIGGNAAGAGMKNANLGTAGNSIVGGIGGLVLGQILGALGMGSPGWPRRKEPRLLAPASTSAR